MKKLKQYEFINKPKEIYNDKYDYNIYINSKVKINIIKYLNKY